MSDTSDEGESPENKGTKDDASGVKDSEGKDSSPISIVGVNSKKGLYHLLCCYHSINFFKCIVLAVSRHFISSVVKCDQLLFHLFQTFHLLVNCTVVVVRLSYV